MVPTARRRMASRLREDDRAAGWLATLAVTLLAGFLRFWHLGTPHAFLFDETYYAKDAWSLWHHGYVTGYADKANEQDPRRRPARALDQRAEHDRAPRGRQVADRSR